MSHKANEKTGKRTFEMENYVYLKLQPYCHTTIAHQISQKIAQKYYCLYLVLDKIGVLAYWLNLSASAAIHLVFRISQLKKHLGNHVTTSTLPCLAKENPLQERRMVKKGNPHPLEKSISSWRHVGICGRFQIQIPINWPWGQGRMGKVVTNSKLEGGTLWLVS